MTERPLRKIVEKYYQSRTGKSLDFNNPQTINEKIQWLKVYGQHPDIPECCDKIGVRDFVVRNVGESFAFPLWGSARTFDGLEPIWKKQPCMIKTNHDGGNYHEIHDEKDVLAVKKQINKALERKYGQNKGEWGYSHVTPKVLIEPIMPEPVIDYKFHCCHGKVLWQQTIMNRKPRPSFYAEEVITDPDGNVLSYHLDEHHVKAYPENFKKPEQWDLMVGVSEWLSKPFKYARVDLYQVWDKVLVGEITFWPLSGCYKSSDLLKFGQMMQFNMMPGPVIHR